MQITFSEFNEYRKNVKVVCEHSEEEKGLIYWRELEYPYRVIATWHWTESYVTLKEGD